MTKDTATPASSIQAPSADSLFDQVSHHLRSSRVRDLKHATALDVLFAVSLTTRDFLGDDWLKTRQQAWEQGKKRVYYLSMEYLPGRLLKDALINSGLYANAKLAVSKLGYELDELCELEEDPGLGNGGLGRLASCFLDSMATLGIAGMGYGIRYEYGIFKQVIQSGAQVEEPDAWLRHGTPWDVPRTENTYRIRYGGRVESHADSDGRTYFKWTHTDDVFAEAHDYPIPGYQNGVVNTLRLWSPRPVVDFDLALFNSGDHQGSVRARNIAENISRVLYPNDSGPPGKELRLRQEYFFVSASLQDAVARHLARFGTLDSLSEHAVFQLNDTHPSLAVAELMRILLDEHRYDWDRAWKITQSSLAYTNHTLLPEALETWPVYMLDQLLPRQLDIIREIDRRLAVEIGKAFPNNEHALSKMSIIERGPQPNVRMGHLSVVGSFSVNGVSALHSRLLRERVFPEYDSFYPKRFGNKTNGVTPRRWLLLCNPELASLVTDAIGDKWVSDFERMSELEKFVGDASFREKFVAIKRNNKQRLASYLQKNSGIVFDPSSLLDIQIKRIHEYKRQLLNLLHVVHSYLEIKDGKIPQVKRTVLIGGKAASAYDMAKRIIHLTNSISRTLENDPQTRDHLRLYFVPNYRVSLAEKLIPAAELSEQISTAGQEASGTGNMKFAMNGALTLGTLDGANVEIKDAVGDENIFIFGLTAEEVLHLEQSGYNPRKYYEEDARIRRVLDALSSGMFSPEEPGRFRSVVDSLLHGDRFLLLADFASYLDKQKDVESTYLDTNAWTTRAILNVARMGRFSSDVTIGNYAREIWGVR